MNYYLLNVFLCLFGCNLAQDNFFPHGKSNGDEVLVDLSKGIGVNEKTNGLFIINTTHIPFFSIKSNTRIQLSTKGYIAFGSEDFRGVKPRGFPIKNSASHVIPTIAVYFVDNTFSNDERSQMTYQIHTSGPVLTQINSDVLKYRRKYFNASFALVVTWLYVRPYILLGDEHMTYQLAMATDGKHTYLFLNYGELNLNAFLATTIGWQEPNPLKYFRHQNSQLNRTIGVDRPIRMAHESNINVPGKWIYHVAKPLAAVPPLWTGPTGTPITIPASCPTSTSICAGRYGNIEWPGHDNFYITCANNSQPKCSPCPPGLSFVERCDQCLRNKSNKCWTTVAPLNTTTVAPLNTTTAITVPFNGCTDARAKTFCSNKPAGRYDNHHDATKQTFFWCYATGANCQRCPPGTVFCSSGDYSGICSVIRDHGK